MIDPRSSYIEIVERLPLLDGRFSNIHRLDPAAGGGAFSLLFRADDALSRQKVALKFFDPMKIGDTYRWLCFEREAKLLADHQSSGHLIPLVSPQSTFTEIATTSMGTQVPVTLSYYAMALAKTNVFELSVRDGLDASAALDLFESMCRAVQYLHRRGLVHRDLKPHNFLVMPNGHLVLGDLGTTSVLSDPPLMPMYGHPPGDVRYTPPELIACLHDVNPSYAVGADFYALGAILFELLTGRPVYAQLFDDQFVHRLWQCFVSIDPAQRRTTFESMIESVVDARPLPSLANFDRAVPPAIRDLANDLCEGLCHLDYRMRTNSFTSVLRQVRICQIVLRHEAEYQRRLALRRARRASQRPIRPTVQVH
jgi:serine/threonine protein kinase